MFKDVNSPVSACRVLLGLLADHIESFKEEVLGIMHGDDCSIVLSAFLIVCAT